MITGSAPLEAFGFAMPRRYRVRQCGLRQHVLVEYEKDLAPLP